MSKVLNEIVKRIDFQRRKLEGLRQEFDRCDANHPHRTVEVARDIYETVAVIEELMRFQKLMKEEGES